MQLLGKWRRRGSLEQKARGFLLKDHMRYVMGCFEALFSEPFHRFGVEHPSFGHALWAAMDLGQWAPFDKFQSLCRLATLAHDLGKCGTEFQTMLWDLEIEYQKTEKMPQVRHQQMYRHEFLSLLVLAFNPEVRTWFEEEAGGEQELMWVAAAAFGHHMKCKESEAIKGIVSPYVQEVKLDLLDVDGLPTFSRWTPEFLSCPGELDWKYDEACEWMAGVSDTPLTRALKWVVILSDVLGSLDAEVGETADEAHERILQLIQDMGRPLQVDYSKRIQRGIPKGHSIYGDQEACRVDGNLVFSSATGSGKTVGSLIWASQRPHTSFIFCDTTMAAVNQHRHDYGLAGDELHHSRSFLYHESYEKGGNQSLVGGLLAEALFTTVDQVIGLVANRHRSILRLPQIVRSQIVFDEVHSYSPLMSQWHKRFLELFPTQPVAHLSATLTEHRITSLGPHIHVKGSPGEGEDTPRWRIRLLSDKEEALQLFQPGWIWFTNTVGRCQEIGNYLPDSKVYHSRYRLKDRWEIRDWVEAEFRSSSPSAGLISTQVAEQALDISALGGITEVAPPATIIQRLGRINRTRHPDKIADVGIYMPSMTSGSPYIPELDFWPEYQRWWDIFQTWNGQTISQADLRSAVEDLPHKPIPRIQFTLFGSHRWPVREAGYTREALLAFDATKMLNKGFCPKEIALLSVPVLTSTLLRSLSRRSPVLKRYIVEADAGTYDSRLGFISS